MIVEPGSFTIAEWCARNRISRSMAYALWERGEGPRRFYVGSKVLISAEADAAWRREREAAAAEKRGAA